MASISTDSRSQTQVRRLFAQRLKINRTTGTVYAVGSNAACDYSLQGVCNTQAEAERMLAQANNGHRSFRTTERGKWIAVYVGYKG
jgi:hypothetical protein